MGLGKDEEKKILSYVGKKIMFYCVIAGMVKLVYVYFNTAIFAPKHDFSVILDGYNSSALSVFKGSKPNQSFSVSPAHDG